MLVIAAAFAGDQWLEVDPGPAPLELRYRVGEHLTQVEPAKVRKDGLDRFDMVSASGARDVRSLAKGITDPIAVLDLLPTETGTLMFLLATQASVDRKSTRLNSSHRT